MAKDKRTSFPSFGFGPSADPSQLLEGCVDYAVLALGHLVSIGWSPTDGRLGAISVSGPSITSVRPVFVRYAREDVSSQFEKAGRHAPFKPGFVCTIPLSGQLLSTVRDCLVSKSELELGVEMEAGMTRRFVVVPIGLKESMQSSILTRPLLQMAVQSLSAVHTTPQLSVELLKTVGQPPSIRAHVDVALTIDAKRMLWSGWVQDAEQGKLVLLNADLTEPPQRLDPVNIPRNDVSSHLRALGSNPTTDRHGFVAIAEVNAQKKYQLCRVSPNGVACAAELEIEPKTASTAELLGSLRRHLAEAGTSTSTDFRRLARAVLGDPKPAPRVAEVRTFRPLGKSESQIRTSIIVPFYGDAFYLLDHLVAQERAPEDVEWIIVCDDPRLASQMLETISNRQHAIRQQTQLVLLSANGGFAQANNIGAAHAKGDYLLLMNSDIYCRDFAFVGRAVSLLASRPEVGCVGFSLQFEDGTIQHDGMIFEKSTWLDDLWVCEHSNKGMPQRWNDTSETAVDAVTAALMLVRRSDFAGNTIFDPSYLLGDFEDADLCMRLRKEGRSIILLRTPGLYHLERQSVRHVGNDDARLAVTHLNCLTFNERWGPALQMSAE